MLCVHQVDSALSFFSMACLFLRIGVLQDAWDEDGKVAVDRKTWKQLTAVEQRAAETLAITPQMWDAELFVDIYERSWNELVPGVFADEDPRKSRTQGFVGVLRFKFVED